MESNLLCVDSKKANNVLTEIVICLLRGAITHFLNGIQFFKAVRNRIFANQILLLNKGIKFYMFDEHFVN